MERTVWVDLERVFICTGGGSVYVWTLKELRKMRTKLWFKQTAGSCNKPVSKDSSATQICTDSGSQGQLHNVSSSSKNNFIQRLKPKGFVSEREGKNNVYLHQTRQAAKHSECQDQWTTSRAETWSESSRYSKSESLPMSFQTSSCKASS